MTIAGILDEADPYIRAIATARARFLDNDREAVTEACEQALRARPYGSEAYFLLGMVAFSSGREGQAIELLEKAHDLDPDIREYADGLASLLARVGRLADSAYYAKLATTLVPHPFLPDMLPTNLADFAENFLRPNLSRHFVAALRYFEAGNLEQAVIHCQEELAINRHSVDAHRLLATVLLRTGRFPQAVAAMHSLQHLAPPTGPDMAAMAAALVHIGRHDHARACCAAARRLAPRDAAVLTAVGRLLPYTAVDYAAEYADLAGALAAATAADAVGSAPTRSPEPGRPLRVGLVSDLLHDCPQALALEAVMKAGREIATFHVYQQSIATDHITNRLKVHAEAWQEIYDIDDESLSYIIAGDDLDVLIYSCGMGDNQRLGLLARRPAAVQLAWLGGPDLAGLPWVDAILTTPEFQAADQKLASAGQRLVVADGPLTAMAPPLMAREVVAPPAVEAGAVTFGGVCDLGLVTAATAELWSRVLHAIPRSRLVLGLMPNVSPSVASEFIDLFGHFGLADRVHLHTQSEDEGEESFFASIDLLLDTHPVSSGQAVANALWMGVPAVSLRGSNRPGLQGAAILAAAGRPEWAVDTSEAFAAAAIGLAADLDVLAALRSDLRTATQASPLYDMTGLARRFHKCLRDAAHSNGG